SRGPRRRRDDVPRVSIENENGEVVEQAMRNVFRAVLLIGVAAGLVYSQQNTDVHLLKVQGEIYMLVGAGGNITAQVGNDGVLLVDTGRAQNADKVRAAVQQPAKPKTNRPNQSITNP